MSSGLAKTELHTFTASLRPYTFGVSDEHPSQASERAAEPL